MLKEKFKTYGDVNLAENGFDGTCSIVNDKNQTIGLIGLLIGFRSGDRVSATNKTVSPKPVNVNLSLRYLQITLNVVEMCSNFDGRGKKRNILLTLPIISQQSHKGGV